MFLMQKLKFFFIIFLSCEYTLLQPFQPLPAAKSEEAFKANLLIIFWHD